jgi:hypothetical protein
LTSQTWVDIATIAGVAFTFIGFGMKQARTRGSQEEKMKTMGRQLHEHDVVIVEHTASLAAHEGSFKVIDNKLDNLKSGQDEVKDSQRKIESLLIQHITKEPRS